MNYKKNIFRYSKYVCLIFILYFASCAPSKETRYEQKPKKVEREIEVPRVFKTMEVRERELVKKLKISSVDRINFENDSNGKLVNKGKISTANYDQKGFLTETIIFDTRGRVQNRYEYKYNDKGIRTASLRYDTQNKPDKKYSYEFDELGNKIKSTRYNMNGKPEKYYVYIYDSALNLISDEWYDISGYLEYKIDTEYNNNRNKTVSYSYDADERLNNRYVFKYDEQMNILVEEQKFDDKDKLIGIIQYLYKYY